MSGPEYIVEEPSSTGNGQTSNSVKNSEPKVSIKIDDHANLLKHRARDSTRLYSKSAFNSSRIRRLSRFSIDLDVDSQVSISSQETEEDVFFPNFDVNVKANGINFSELEQFVLSEAEIKKYKLRSGQNSIEPDGRVLRGKNALKYTPTIEFADQQSIEVPSRFSFYHTENELTIHAPDLTDLVSNSLSWSELFKKGKATWWLDCTCPTDGEMKAISKAFGIHPLTAEDIRMQESREKVELFPNYYFVSFHTFEQDKESENYLEPIKMFIVVFKDGVLSFKFAPSPHPANVRRRARQLSDYVNVVSDWICYALIDDITDAFAPVIESIEFEADAIEDFVHQLRTSDFSHMLRHIGRCRKMVMTIMRLLTNKADVIKMFANRCRSATSPGDSSVDPLQPYAQMAHQSWQPSADIALYLGDIQDHILTMFQRMSAYEKIFSRAESNYLSQLQVESLDAGMNFSRLLENLTIIGTVFVPLNLITGLFGMNVLIPGKQGSTYWWFVGIVLFMVFISVSVFALFKWWIRLNEKKKETEESDMISQSIRTKSMRSRLRSRTRSMANFLDDYRARNNA